jgi:hypothetical protein
MPSSRPRSRHAGDHALTPGSRSWRRSTTVVPLRQEHRGRRDVLRLAGAAERDLGLALVAELAFLKAARLDPRAWRRSGDRAAGRPAPMGRKRSSGIGKRPLVSV